ncbi:MAG: hypothetical protein ACRECO_10730 [Xanthobacteraceae bacterium]
MRLTSRRSRRTRPAHFPQQAAIFERLEVTKRYGLVSDYLVSGGAGEASPRVTVWGRNGTPSDVVEHYIARLLNGLVAQRQISIAVD